MQPSGEIPKWNAAGPFVSTGGSSSRPDGVEPARITVPDYELLRRIGAGAYGEVWLARNVLGEFRAVKIIHRSRFSDARPCEREFEGIQRFEPISRSHPSQLAILHVGKNDAAGCFYYVMELADDATPPVAAEVTRLTSNERGINQSLVTSAATKEYIPRTLRSDLEQHTRLPIPDCIQIGLSLTTALAHLHQHGLVHRDIKPSNVIFVNDVPKLGDIGLVTEAGDTHSIVGTEGYLPPEGPGTPQADIFSLGKLLYEISTGLDRRRFPELPEDLREWPDRRAVVEFNEILLKACAKDPERRYQSAVELGKDLERLQRGKSVRTRRNFEQALNLTKRAIPIAALLALLTLVFINPRQKQGQIPVSAVKERVSIFVLPFRNTGTNAVENDRPWQNATAYIDDLRGDLTDAFIDALPLIHGVKTGPRKSGWVSLNEDELRRSLAKTNTASHILTGQISTTNDTISLTVCLYEARNDQPLLKETFAGKTNDLIALERDSIERIADKLGLRITEGAAQQIDQKLLNKIETLRLT
ncbi:MAG: hypothetical protein EXS31_01615 [Pedosphaera sp.]|nr:hypothetical protein [Pedosphaera sp.]